MLLGTVGAKMQGEGEKKYAKLRCVKVEEGEREKTDAEEKGEMKHVWVREEMNNSHLFGRKRPEQMSAIHAPPVTASILGNKHSHHCDSNHEFLCFIRFSSYRLFMYFSLSLLFFLRFLFFSFLSLCRNRSPSHVESKVKLAQPTVHPYKSSGRIFTAARRSATSNLSQLRCN